MLELSFVVARREICNRPSFALQRGSLSQPQQRNQVAESVRGARAFRAECKTKKPISTVDTRVPVTRREARKMGAKPLWLAGQRK